MNMKRKQGISLIVLIITIIVVIILATAVILSVSNNNPIEKAKEAKFLNDVKVLEEKYALENMNKYFDDNEDKEITINDLTDNEEYRKKFEIKDGKIVLKKSEATEEELKWASKNDIQVKKEKYTLKQFPNEGNEETAFLGMGKRMNITKVIFEDSTKNAPKNANDLSEAGNNGILGWIDGTEAHIASDGEIFANKDSSELFSMVPCTAIENLNLLNTSEVTDMSQMFYLCTCLTSLDVSNFDTSNVTSMSSMFGECNRLTNLDVSNFNTSNVTSMNGMFLFCEKLTSLDVSNFDTSNVIDMGSMFDGCFALTNLDVNNFDTSNVTDMYAMFMACKALTSIDVSSFNTASVTEMNSMFEACSNLTTIYASEAFKTDNVMPARTFCYVC